MKTCSIHWTRFCIVFRWKLCAVISVRKLLVTNNSAGNSAFRDKIGGLGLRLLKCCRSGRAKYSKGTCGLQDMQFAVFDDLDDRSEKRTTTHITNFETFHPLAEWRTLPGDCYQFRFCWCFHFWHYRFREVISVSLRVFWLTGSNIGLNSHRNKQYFLKTEQEQPRCSWLQVEWGQLQMRADIFTSF